ncbi:MucR family transcriptional regulator (plasmid) [Mesorhizobium sp. AR10]|uniref:MucR family transcriptional regulator n=1 Tax=Mesorhizobium sp. AR10 TaxID=2865839 RepID=UPI00215E318F|nr:MucR family transcriptional regulator [Mesorhizobium sp. AR10]UVK35532.1 MucR family transcriptional regulator [Mesorhizobium sp. AR10]
MADDASEQANSDLLGLTAGIVAAYVQNNATSVSGLPDLIASVNAALAGLLQPAAPTAPVLTPASSPKRSVTSDFIVCLEDGKKFKSLKRYLATHFGTTPAEYRTKWGLLADYPMVAPNYTARRSALAKSIGLGRTPAAKTPAEKVPTKRKAKA